MAANRASKQLPHERRRGEASLSEFVEYVETQHAARNAGWAGTGSESTTTTTATTTAITTAITSPNSSYPASIASSSDHTELDELFDALDFGDNAAPPPPLRDLLLGVDEESLARLEAIVSDRIAEGHGETLFELGRENGGDSMGLSRDEWAVAYGRLVEAARRARADCDLLITTGVGGAAEAEAAVPTVPATSAKRGSGDAGGGCTGLVLIRHIPVSMEEVIETRIAVIGNVDAGKSSMLGVLVKGDLDDGRGKARVNLFRHKHEVESGRTSSVGMEIMGFDTVGNVIRPENPARKLGWDEIGRRSAKIITFTDLAGHERYLRTTVFGLLSSSPNYCLLMVAANNGLVGMSKEHLGIALALNVPVMVVVTKIDICPPQILEQTLDQIAKILRSPGARKVPILIRTRDECISTAAQLVGRRVCPVFQVSNVTGQNLDLVRAFLNVLPHHGRYDPAGPLEFHINDTFSVPFAGTVVSGIVRSGTVREGDAILIGPDPTGRFVRTSIRSIERRRARVSYAAAGQSASFALKKIRRRDVRKGMVVLPVLSPSGEEGHGAEPRAGHDFVAEVLILSHATTIQPNYQATLHVGAVAQTCAIIAIDRELIRTGDRATVAFRFMQRPEYVVPGDRILFREGRTRGLGIVKAVGYDPSSPLLLNWPGQGGGHDQGGGGLGERGDGEKGQQAGEGQVEGDEVGEVNAKKNRKRKKGKVGGDGAAAAAQ